MVMPEIGLDEFPIRPVIREETATKKKPNTRIRSDPRMLPGKRPVGRLGSTAMTSASKAEPARTHRIGMSRSVRLAATAPCTREARRSPIEPRTEATIVGSVRISVLNPAIVTAPAPM